MQKITDKGFTVIIAAIALGILATIAAGGWLVWNSRQNSNTNHSEETTQTKTPNQSQQEESSIDPVDPSEGGKYLYIEEWGVRVALPENLRGDISYFVNDRAERDFGGPVLIDFTSKRFSKGNLKCAVVENEDLPRTLLSLERVSGENQILDEEPISEIDGTKYYLTSNGCEEVIQKSGSDEDKQLIASLKKAITDTLEKY